VLCCDVVLCVVLWCGIVWCGLTLCGVMCCLVMCCLVLLCVVFYCMLLYLRTIYLNFLPNLLILHFSHFSIFLCYIMTGCNPLLRIPGSIPSNNSHTNLPSSYTKKNKTVRPFQEVYPPYGLCNNNYNNSHNQHLHDYDHESYNGGAMLRANESNNDINNLSSISDSNNDNHNNNNGNNVNDNNDNSSSGSNYNNNNNQNGQNVQNGNNAFPNPNVYQTFNSFYDDVHATSIDENGNKIPQKIDLNYSRINDDRLNEVNKLKNLDKNNIVFESESPSNFSNPTGIKKFKPVRTYVLHTINV
jgi:hypothetical protein